MKVPEAIAVITFSFLENGKWFDDGCVQKYFNQGLWMFYVSSEEIKERRKRWDKHWCCRRGGAWNCLPLICPFEGLSWFIAAIDIAGNMSSSITNRALLSCKSKGDQNSYVLQKYQLKWFVFFCGWDWDGIISELPVWMWCFQVLYAVVKTGSVE